MTLWTVLVTGLFAGGISCAFVQGGLLAGAVARRRATSSAEIAPSPTPAVQRTRLSEDVVPIGGFLVGKLVSHTVLGAGLGLIGEAAQLGFRARATMQIIAGLMMFLMALDLLGVKAVRRFIPTAPAPLGRLMRRSGRTASAFGPAILGFATVLIPCGVTLSMEFLAVSSGSAVSGALIMATFVVGTSPLFAVLGYAVRRSAASMRGAVGKLAAVAVLVVGLITINTGLVLAGSPVTFGAIRDSFARARVDLVTQGQSEIPKGEQASDPVRVVDGVQLLAIDALTYAYEPVRIEAKSGMPTTLTVRTDKTRSCTRSFVIPSLGLQEILPETGRTEFTLGPLPKGETRFTCAMGMYSGVINVT